MSEVKIVESKIFAAGLTDGGHTYFECADCGKKIGGIWHTDKDARKKDGTPLTQNVQFKCCYCQGSSYEKTITGGFHYGGYKDETKLKQLLVDTNELLLVEVSKGE
jgi:hypothetical protein